jgi:ParB family chromosome partitioning protein
MTKKTSTGLGRGLDALLPSAVEFTEQGIKFRSPDDAISTGGIALIEISKIVHNQYQPRKEFEQAALNELRDSIIEHGVISPITVRKAINGYEIVAGERRLRASIAAGLTKIPAYVIDVETPMKMLELALIENVQREDLNPIEIATGFAALIEDHNLTQEEVGKKIGKDRSTVANYLRLLNLPVQIQDALRTKQTTMGHARAILAHTDKKVMLKIWDVVQQKQLNVRETEKLARDVALGLVVFRTGSKETHNVKKEKVIPADLRAIIDEKENIIRRKLSAKVRIIPRDDVSGVIELTYNTIDDFERITRYIVGEKEI